MRSKRLRGCFFCQDERRDNPSPPTAELTPPSHSRCASVAGSLLQLLALGGFAAQKTTLSCFLLATIASLGRKRGISTKYLRQPCRRDFDGDFVFFDPKQYTPPSHSRCASVAGSLLHLLALGGFAAHKTTLSCFFACYISHFAFRISLLLPSFSTTFTLAFST